jgi:hypothetical protein
MSIFASRRTKTVEIPFDPPNTVTIQALAGRHLERAQQETQFASADSLKRLGGIAFQRELAQLGDDNKRDELVKQHQADPLNSYDKYTVNQRGIVSWSYPESLKPETYQDETGQTVTRVKALDDLDSEAVDFFAREILQLSKPSLFLTDDETKAAQVKG